MDVGWPPLLPRRVRLIRPIHPFQLLAARARQPVLPVAEAYAKAARHGALRLTTPNRRHHSLPIFFRASFIHPPDQTDLDQMALARLAVSRAFPQRRKGLSLLIGTAFGRYASGGDFMT
jgi:hypothetical protein